MYSHFIKTLLHLKLGNQFTLKSRSYGVEPFIDRIVEVAHEAILPLLTNDTLR